MKFYLCATNCSEYLGDNGRYDSNKIPEGAHIEWYKDDRGYHDEMYVDLHTIDELLSFAEKVGDEIIVKPSSSRYRPKTQMPEIEIYNDYRE